MDDQLKLRVARYLGTLMQALGDLTESISSRHTTLLCDTCDYCLRPWPCPDSVAASAALDALDGGGDR